LYHYCVHELPRWVLSYIRKQDILRPGDRVGVAVSGGADSVALLRILLELGTELGVVLSVVHLNHGLRAEESDADEQFVHALSAHYDLPFFSQRRDVKAYASEKKLSIETAAREVRYQYFEELLRKDEFNKLATAHTLDDQAETVLLKLARGAGTRGLAGIYPKVAVEYSQKARESRASELAIVRPLLTSQRSDLEQYLAQMQQPWREDSTNAELHHTRNRIRHEVLPRLCADVNPQVRRTLAEVAEIARAEEEFWQEDIQRHLAGAWSRKEQGGILSRSWLNGLPVAVRRRVVRGAAEFLGLSLEFKHVEEVLGLCEGTQTILPDGWVARCQRDSICFNPSSAIASEDYKYELPVPGHVVVPEAGVGLTTVVLDGKSEGSSYNPDHVLDFRFASSLVVRNWRAGDRFSPANSKQPKKIKELLQDRQITGDTKKSWPVIASGEEVVWLRGFGVGSDFRNRNGVGVLIGDEPLNKKRRTEN
jgi:tRNA(Ile)-lysidine synthase